MPPITATASGPFVSASVPNPGKRSRVKAAAMGFNIGIRRLLAKSFIEVDEL